MHPMQAMLNGMSKGWQTKRAESQMTLGKLIALLEKLDGNRLISGLGELDSYRGYYDDLAFLPETSVETAAVLLGRCRAAMGKVFQGYKGGDYVMGELTPLWISPYGEASGERLMSLNLEVEPILPVTAKEE